MCDPITLTGIALTAGSMFANNRAASQVNRARESAISAENARQAQLDREAAALNAQSRNRYDNFTGGQGEKAKELGDFLTAQSQPVQDAGAAAEPVLPRSASNIVVAEEGKQRGEARAFGRQQDASLAQLRSFGDFLGAISRDQATDAQRIGTIGGFMRGSQGVLPLELEAANQAGGKWSTLGTVLGTAGSIATMAGLSGATFGGAAAGGPTKLGPFIKGGVTPAGSITPYSPYVPSSLGGLY